MVLDERSKKALTILMEVLKVLLAWNNTLLQIAACRKGRGRGNGIIMNPRHNQDGLRNGALRRMYLDNEVHCYSQLRMGRPLFHRFCDRLKGLGLRDSRYLVVEEQVAMFLWTVGHDKRNRNGVLQFYRSGQTISHYFHKVLAAVLRLYVQVVPNATAANSPMVDCSTQHPWHVYFQDAVGAVDGTHFKTKVPVAHQGRYRNRKGVVTQNILVACTFDMRFTYVLVGWEGSMHDGRLLKDAVSRDGHMLTVPQGKYYLADTGFALVPGFLTPYRSVRYHLNEQGNPPQNAKELYNFRHSSLRTVVERTIGVLKMRFAYLRHRPFHDVRTHSKIILACCAIHNWLKEVAPEDEFFAHDVELEVNGDNVSLPHVVDDDATFPLNMATSAAWTTRRDEIAEQMWNTA